VIVESPAKAKTIASFLGDEYVVESSVGHIRDLPSKGLSVDVDNDFKVVYEVHASKKDVIRRLKAALKDADELYLATDEDREGEAISWHLLEVLKPTVPVKRMVFHEITRTAIEHSVENWRDINYPMVDAQETRRIVDRLFGYPVSEVVWRKVQPRLSAGRVQSPAVRLVVERERERMAFVAAGYWDLDAAFPTDPAFTAKLVAVDGNRVATGKDFDSRGNVTRDDIARLDESAARALVDDLAGREFKVRSVETKPYRSSPRPPFMTSTLQQEGGRKLGMTSQQVMRVAQGLYERGYITYMRTDSTTLSETALNAARAQIRSLYGDAYVPDAPRQYAKKVKNAQEAHEAIRPAGDDWRTPDQLARELQATDLRLYDLIWKRTLASQMTDATGQTVSVRIGAQTESGTDTEFAASGTTITFPGYRRVYVESTDDAAVDGEHEALLPALAEGDAVPEPALTPEGLAREGARGSRHRPPVHVCLDHGHDPRPRLRLEEGQRAGADVDSVRGHQPARAALRLARRLRLHGQHGGRPRSHRQPRAGASARAAQVLVRERHSWAQGPGGRGPRARRSGDHQRHPDRRRRGRRRDRGAQREVRAVPQAGRRHGLGAGGHLSRRAVR
jgi:DNA topoisomerase-1